MILPLDRLSETDFFLSDILVVRCASSERIFGTKSRYRNGFLYFTQGTFEFSSPENEFRPAAGTVLYLPSGCRFSMRVTSPDYTYYQINFRLFVNGEYTRFSDAPELMTESAPSVVRDAAEALEEECRAENRTVFKNEKLCSLFTALGTKARRLHTSRLEPAVRYLQSHLTQPVECRALSSLCYLGTAQFYSLFRTEYGMTPLEYRNKLLLRRAELLLESDEFAVSEVGDMLGFTSSAYFSRFFRKHEGVSPSAYRRARLTSLTLPGTDR